MTVFKLPHDENNNRVRRWPPASRMYVCRSINEQTREANHRNDLTEWSCHHKEPGLVIVGAHHVSSHMITLFHGDGTKALVLAANNCHESRPGMKCKPCSPTNNLPDRQIYIQWMFLSTGVQPDGTGAKGEFFFPIPAGAPLSCQGQSEHPRAGYQLLRYLDPSLCD